MAGHQVVRMRPAGKRLDAAEPRSDVLVFGRDVEAEFLRRIVEITSKGYVGDGRLRAEEIGPAR